MTIIQIVQLLNIGVTMKTNHTYTEELEDKLMMLTDDQLMEWFENNKLDDKDLLELIICDSILEEVKRV